MKDRLQKVNEKNVGRNGYDENEFIDDFFFLKKTLFQNHKLFDKIEFEKDDK